MPGKSMHHNDVMNQALHSPDDFFFHVKIAADLLDFSVGREIDNKSRTCSDVRIPEWSGRVIPEEITSRSASYTPTMSLDAWFQWSILTQSCQLH